jgi:tRNA modification GTPase
VAENNGAIFALSSGQGKAGVAVIRVSGKDCRSLAADYNLTPRRAHLLNFHNIDNIIIIYFKAPNSFTGEDVIELHCHGGQAVISAIFEKLRSFGFRMAEPGEFSRRAFQNGKMDLTEIDGMRALIDARTERQRLRAMRGIAGRDNETYMRWREDMIALAALAAARMDYASDDLPKDVDRQILDRRRKLAEEIKAALNSRSRIVESGFNVVLTGETNVGKSSLFNRLIGESRAIVSDIAGTTRDVISAELDLEGYLVRLIDTAGLREAENEIEKIGISKTNEQVKKADLVIRVYDSPDGKPSAADNEIVVINKSDLIEKRRKNHVYVSAKTGEGVGELLDLIKRKVLEQMDGAESDLAVGERAQAHLLNAVSELEGADGGPEIESEHIMSAADEIGRILGTIGSDEIYDSVFGQLCLGK